MADDTVVGEEYYVRRAPIVSRGGLDEQPEAVQKLFKAQVGFDRYDEVYVFGLIPSNQAFDAYGTRQSASALRGYLKDAKAGAPLMNSHRTGGGFFIPEPRELPLGYTFSGELAGEAVDESALLDRRDVKRFQNDKHLSVEGLMLKTMDYVLRSHYPNGEGQLGTDDLIRGIEARIHRDISIGFGHRRPERVLLTCGLCGLPLGRGRYSDDEDEEVCRHVPLVRDKKSGLLGFAWLSKTMMYEHSIVWKGATPGAIVDHARHVAALGVLDPEDIDMLEDRWHVRIMDVAVQPVPERSISMAGDVEVIETSTDDGGVERDEVSSLEGVMERAEATDGEISTIVATLEELTQTVVGVREAVDTHNKVVGKLLDRVLVLEERAVVAQESAEHLFAQLVEEAVEARVRALGAETFDVEAYRKVLQGWSAEQVQAEVETYDAVAKRVFAPGRLTAGATRQNKTPPANAGGSDTHLYLGV